MSRGIALWFGSLVFAFGVVACGPAPVVSITAPKTPTKTDENRSVIDSIKGYRSWRKANDSPYQMSLSASAACISLPSNSDPGQVSAAVATNPGPHTARLINVYVNAPGSDVFVNPPKPLPVGTIVVKEKRDSEKQPPVLLTVMVKTANTGTVDDWQFSAISGDEKRELKSDTAKCRSCHENAGPDHLFRSYVIKRA